VTVAEVTAADDDIAVADAVGEGGVVGLHTHRAQVVGVVGLDIGDADDEVDIEIVAEDPGDLAFDDVRRWGIGAHRTDSWIVPARALAATV
jgi:hypothetical protein